MATLEIKNRLKTEDIPTLPEIALKIMKMIMLPETSLQDISKLISKDVTIASKILRVANSAYYGRNKDIANITQAATLLGTNAIRNIAFQVSLKSSFAKDKFNPLHHKIFSRILFAAAAAEHISKLAGFKQNEDVFLAGLFSEIGMLVLLTFYGEDYKSILEEAEKKIVDLSIVEKEWMDLTHIDVGVMAIDEWDIPSIVRKAVEYHHDVVASYSGRPTEKETQVVECAYLGALLADIYFGWNRSVNIARLKADLSGLMSISEEESNTLIKEMPDIFLSLAETMNIDPPSFLTYTNMLQDANQELAQINLKYGQLYHELQQTTKELEKKNKMLTMLADELNIKNDQLRDLAHRDSLTQLYNRRGFKDYSTKQFNIANRYGRPLALILIDIDHFKAVNDTYGHQSGDLVLKGLAKILEQQVRDAEIVARFGGEEFVFILPETDNAGAASVAERIRKKIINKPFDTVDQGTINITCSFGVSAIQENIKTIEALIEVADQHLYKAKNSGRNRVCF